MDDLHKVVVNVFKYIKPKLIVITTPNKDFNKNFPNFTDETMCHYDHKFEWRANEFVSWYVSFIF